MTPAAAIESGSTIRSSQRITSKPSTATPACTTAIASAVGTSGGRTSASATAIAWIPNPAVSAWAANQYVEAITR